jgi:hypothetical protein
MRRRLEDRIGELCAKAVKLRGTEGFDPAIAELKAALREHAERLRKMAAINLADRRHAMNNRRVNPSS